MEYRSHKISYKSVNWLKNYGGGGASGMLLSEACFS
jgi:hypothetical protein